MKQVFTSADVRHKWENVEECFASGISTVKYLHNKVKAIVCISRRMIRLKLIGGQVMQLHQRIFGTYYLQ